MIARIRRDAHLSIPREALYYGGFIAQRDIDGADEQDSAFFLARVVAALEQSDIDQFGRRDVKALRNGLTQCLGRVIERQRQLGNANQVTSWPVNPAEGQ